VAVVRHAVARQCRAMDVQKAQQVATAPKGRQRRQRDGGNPFRGR